MEGKQWLRGLCREEKKAIGGLIVVYTIVFGVWMLLFQKNEEFQLLGRSMLSLFSSLFTGFYLYRACQRTTSDKPFWCLLLSASIINIGEEVVRCYGHYIGKAAVATGYINALGALCLLCIIMAFISIVHRQRGCCACYKLLLDIALLVIVAYSFIYWYIGDYFLAHADDLPSSFLLYIAYPLVFLGLAIGIAKFYSDSKWFSKGVLNLFLAALALMIVGDIAYLWFTFYNLNYLANWSYLLYGIGNLLVALAGILHCENKFVKQGTVIAGYLTDNVTELAVSYLLVVVLLGILATELQEVNSLAIGVLFCLILITIRQVLSIVENKKLLQSLRQKNIELQDTLYIDYLTALPNRFQLLYNLRPMRSPCLAIINIENFRAINEFYGYQTGDKLLQDVAQKVVELAAPYQYMVYRLAGDEYAVLADGEEELLKKWVISAHDSIEKTAFKIIGQIHYIFVTMGLALTNDNPLEKAQMALQYARQHNLRMQVYHDQLPVRDNYQSNLYWIQEVQDAIKENRIILYYQPIQNLLTGKAAKYEVLVRMRARDGQIIAPARFLPIIKKTKLYPRLTEVVLTKSFAYFAAKEVDFAINLSAADIGDAAVQGLIMKLLASSQLGPHVTFEFVESEEFEDPQALSQFIAKIKKYQAKIAIDDFGSGYSNFAYIMTMEADYIKIDGSLIKEIATNQKVQAIVESIVYFARQLQIKTIAEFVSSEQICHTAGKIGVDEVQGYFIGEPKPYL